MSEPERSRYEALEAHDRRRFDEESAAADAEAEVVQQARRDALMMQEGETVASRGARQRVQSERDEKMAARERRKLLALEHADPEELEERERQAELKRKETEDRRKQKRQQEAELAKQHKKLDKEEAKKASQRLEYLLKQSSIFAKLQGGKSGSSLEHVQSPTRSSLAAAGGAHHIHTEESPDEDEAEEDNEDHVFLTKQPSTIKFGQMKAYQLEALNWMIHLSEKGLNGILADEM